MTERMTPEEALVAVADSIDALFAPAGVEHRFVDFTDDFGTWVVSYGPAGGERLA